MIKIFCDRCGGSLPLEGLEEIKQATTISLKTTEPPMIKKSVRVLCDDCVESYKAWLKELDGP